jgi:hypothetical protein
MLTAMVYPPRPFHLLGKEIIARKNRSQLRLGLKGLQVIPDSGPNTHLLSIRWCVLGYIKPLRLLVQQEDITMGATGWWGPRTCIIRDEWCIARNEVGGAVGGPFRLEAGL